MSKIEELLLFRIADLDDVNSIMEFIRNCWNSEHILARSRDFFIYEYKNGEKLNFLLAENKKSKRIEAIYAFYLYSTPSIAEKIDIAGGLSRVRDDCPIPMVGTYMYKKLLELFNVRCMLGVGVKRQTAYEINRRLFKYTMGKLSHYYRLSDVIDDYRIAKIRKKNVKQIQDRGVSFEKYSEPEDLFLHYPIENYKERITYKDKRYIIHRYFNHPIYNYEFYLIDNELVLICREIVLFERKILRIIDCIGNVDALAKIGYGIQKLIDANGYEYVDLMAYGICDEIMEEAGFEKVNDDDKNIIPNYFEPFIKENVDVFCTSSVPNTVIFKGDADQDRPNTVNGDYFMEHN